MAVFDLSKIISSKTITLKKNSTGTIEFKNDIAGQVVMSESGNNILFTVYKAQKTTYSYTKMVEFYDYDNETAKYKLTTTKYVYAKNANDNNWSWQMAGKSATHAISAWDVPAQVTGDKKYWVTYTMKNSGNSSPSTSSFYATESADEMDDDYLVNCINKYGTTSKSLTDKVMAKITIKNADKATSLELKSAKNANYDNVMDEYFNAIHKDNKYTGTFLNEIATSTDLDETFNLKAGDDVINYSFLNGYGKMGDDEITLSKDEFLTLNLLNSTQNDTSTADPNAEMYVNTGYLKKGNDLIVKFSNEYGASLGQTTIKNYFKMAKNNVELLYSGANNSVIDKEYFLKDVLEYEEGIGMLGNVKGTKTQRITGNFLNNTITTGSGKDVIKAVAGDNTIVAGAGADTIYSGSGSDCFYIYDGDARNGDVIYNAAKTDSLYFFDNSGAITTTNFVNNFIFTKKGNNLVVEYNPENIHAPMADIEKVSFINYFKNNTEMLNINDATDYSALKVHQTAKGTVKGTDCNDDIMLTGKSNVYTGKGDDIVRYYNEKVTEESVTTPVDQNVTTYINGTGTKTFVRVGGVGTNAGDMGNKTIVFQNAEAKTAVAYLNLIGSPANPSDPAIPKYQGYIYSKKGNNLNIEGYYGDTEYNPKSMDNTYDSYGTYIIKDYFKANNNIGTIYLDNELLDLEDDIISQEGKMNTASTFYDTIYNDVIVGANKNDKYYFMYGGEDLARDLRGNDTYTFEVNSNASEVKVFDEGKGNDKYNFTNSNLSTTVYINDDGGTKDSLNIKSLDQKQKISVGVLFNVLNKNKITGETEAKYLKDDALFLYNKAYESQLKTTGHIEIGNYFVKDDSGNYSEGAGVIESMKVDGNNIDVSHLDEIRSQVVAFLSNTNYVSAYECLMKGNAPEVTNLIAAYTYNS